MSLCSAKIQAIVTSTDYEAHGPRKVWIMLSRSIVPSILLIAAEVRGCRHVYPVLLCVCHAAAAGNLAHWSKIDRRDEISPVCGELLNF